MPFHLQAQRTVNRLRRLYSNQGLLLLMAGEKTLGVSSGITVRQITAAVITVIFSITLAVTALHIHYGNDSGHKCEFCYLSHLPALTSGEAAQISGPAILISLVTIDTPSHESHLFLAAQPARAPPA